jgi:hypothetical protein
VSNAVTVWTIKAADLEWVGPVTVKLNGVTVTSFELAVVDAHDPAAVPTWVTPTPLDGGDGVLIGSGGDLGPLARGDYWLEAKFTSSPETIILDRVGLVVVT